MNISIISGRVSKEISVKGKVGYFTLANDRDYPFNKDQNGNKVSNFLTCKILGEKNIQRAQQYLTKGTAIIVTGHYFRDSWKDNNGNFQEFNFVLVEKWEFQTGKASNEESTPVSGSYSSDTVNNDTHTESTENPQSNEQPQSQPEPQTAPEDDFINIPDGIENELPFR